MKNNSNTSIERIIAKIDNDFNPDNSDWIPRVAAWCIDAMNMIDVLRTEVKERKLIVMNKIAVSPCKLDKLNLKVFDSRGCEIKKANKNYSCCDSSTGGEILDSEQISGTLEIVHRDNNNSDFVYSESRFSKDFNNRYNVQDAYFNKTIDRNYVIVDDYKIELNFETDCIIIKQEEIETYCSDNYNCELPVIPNNGLLIEALGYYCIYKMLCRGYKHPVFNLAASQYGTNPYFIWERLRHEAKRSIINKEVNNIDDTNLWRSSFYISTFNPKK